MTTPAARPRRAQFSSGPCAKRPGYSLQNLDITLLGRSHRAGTAKALLKRAIDLSREILGVPAGYRIGIVPASDTGAVEMALWSLLGARGVDVLAWESFGEGWVADVLKQLKLADVRTISAPYGELPDLSTVDAGSRDVVFTWNGTTSGVRVPNADWIAADRQGLSICDATSAAFAQDLDWQKLDVATFSWQKALGGEAAHGMLVLSPRAVERLQTYKPAWPLPKIFRLTSGGKLIEGIFEGETINTPSMLCVEDYIDALEWAKSIGGLKALMARADANAKVIADWTKKAGWADFLARDARTRSNTSVCLKIIDPDVVARGPEAEAAAAKGVVAALEKENVAYDIGAYRDAPPGLRIWCGATVDAADVLALTHWLNWAFAIEKGKLAQQPKPTSSAIRLSGKFLVAAPKPYPEDLTRRISTILKDIPQVSAAYLSLVIAPPEEPFLMLEFVTPQDRQLLLNMLVPKIETAFPTGKSVNIGVYKDLEDVVAREAVEPFYTNRAR